MEIKCTEKNCKNIAVLSDSESRVLSRCKKHKQLNDFYFSVEKKQIYRWNGKYWRLMCQHECCMKQPVFGKKGTKNAIFCVEHKEINHVNVKSKRCQHECCMTIPVFGKKGTTNKIFCVEHKEINHVNVTDKKCQHEGCMTIPGFGKKGTKNAIFCVEHKEINHVNVTNKKCQHEGCMTTPVFGKKGTKNAIFCVEHKEINHVNVTNKKCQHEGCMTIPGFGKNGTKNAIFCFEHKEINHVNVTHKKCQHEGCMTIPGFGKNGTKNAIFCVEHKEINHVNVTNKKCQHEGCMTIPGFGKKGTKNAIFCVEHKEINHVNVTNKKCQHNSCTKRANFGPLFLPKIHCSAHKNQNEYIKNNPKCEDCNGQPFYTDDGTNYPKRCEKHKKISKDVNIIEKKCTSCELPNFINDKEGLCNDCRDFKIMKTNKKKENIMKNFLNDNDVEFKSNDKIPDGSCFRYRPDFLIDNGDHIIVLENDENQHKTYACECEISRMINIFNDQGGMPLTIIRFNPDSYKDQFGKTIRANNSRFKELLCVINALKLHPPYKTHGKIFTVCYLFYDGYDKTIKLYNLDYENHKLELLE